MTSAVARTWFPAGVAYRPARPMKDGSSSLTAPRPDAVAKRGERRARANSWSCWEVRLECRTPPPMTTTIFASSAAAEIRWLIARSADRARRSCRRSVVGGQDHEREESFPVSSGDPARTRMTTATGEWCRTACSAASRTAASTSTGLSTEWTEMPRALQTSSMLRSWKAPNADRSEATPSMIASTGAFADWASESATRAFKKEGPDSRQRTARSRSRSEAYPNAAKAAVRSSLSTERSPALQASSSPGASSGIPKA